ncbi:DUF992 domain-containing protein [Aestuariivirga litoralis]|uniref:DUF992 domain-containing protein n=1 Tax=Aestuariivirga litoralis TaxID=2650924 RepID=A0A2W2AX92_9HYPH|nr:DUF992 domain-containing protein [Aestuariivirga litoralis]PZF78372.1 DUF992 domain-containing protein [Aestuariivirga litoralis]
MKKIAASLLALGLLTLPAHADGGVKLGMLVCDVSGSIGLILGGTESASCTFQGPNGTEYYKGRITQVGLDIGVTAGAIMSWAVFAPGQVGKGALAGTYAGATADASFAVGLGANVLVGGSQQSIALQPVSVEGQAGVNVAAGLASFKLEYVP